MSEYLVEVYVSRRAASQLPTQDVISGVAAELTRAGKQVNFVRSILLPDDETCLYHFEGDSDAVR
ncbi:MAG TPA: hypothetical protein VGS21_05045, partial [Acidimicrobiales bacterium]|nr:hypothetical protein [Acidimicrobiales bacterium]